MLKLRLVFTKGGSAVWLSHLDTMRTLTRAFSRAAIPIRHTEGYNPHPFLSIAHPLSVGVSGLRELADCELMNDDEPDVVARLNAKLPQGITIISMGDAAIPVSEAKSCEYSFIAEYDGGVPDNESLNRFFASVEPLLTEKKSKQGTKMIDLRDYVSNIRFLQQKIPTDQGIISGTAKFLINDAPISPKYLMTVLPEELAPDYVAYTRLGFYKQDGSLFA
jgi:radical SAM-linked protein